LLLAGCTSFTDKSRAVTDWLTDDPVPERRSIQELYYEALEAGAVSPENTITPYDSNSDTKPYFDGGESAPPPAPPAENDCPTLFQVPRQPLAVQAGMKREDAMPVHTATGRGLGPRIALTSGNDARGALVSEIFEGTDIRQAIQAIAAQANVSVIIDEGVGGSTSAIIENEPFETALQRILLPLGLVYKREGDHYLIGKDDPASSMFPMLAETREYRPLNLSPQELAALLPQRFKPYVSVAEKRNMIIVEAPPARLQEIHERLQRFDQPVPQVVLEAIVCVISPESGFRSGLDWGHALTLGDRELLNIGLAGLTLGGSVTPLGLQNYFNDFAVTSAFVRLLAQEGYLTIRAAPRVMAKDGEKAEISIGRESFFSIQPVNSQFLFRQDIERVEAGITLNITPVIRGDNITVMIEKAEVSEDIRTKDFNPQINNNPFPLINRRRVATTVSVQDGKTIVIGGLVTRQTVDRVSRVPVLGHCPGIGRMFEIVEKEEKDVEVVIFISPRLVTAPAVAASDEASPTTPPPAWEIQPAAPMPPPAPPPPAEDHTASALRPVGGVRSTSLPKLPPPRIVP
jgi:type II secretory pathway component GspD/PulD (secretin)